MSNTSKVSCHVFLDYLVHGVMTCLRPLQEGGVSGFLHSFIAEVFAMVRAHVAALGGNAVVSYSMKECVLMENPNKNQVRTHLQCWKYLFSGRRTAFIFFLCSSSRLSVSSTWVVMRSSASGKQTRRRQRRRQILGRPVAAHLKVQHDSETNSVHFVSEYTVWV